LKAAGIGDSVDTETIRPNGGSGLSLLLDQNVRAPSLARAAVAAFCDNHGISKPTVAMVKLLVSEVVSNAVVHPEVTRASIGVSAQIEDQVIHIEITDAGDGFEPAPPPPPLADRGYGLFLVDRQSSRWGVRRGNGTTVWFEVPTV
jgi:anti-sigma regulatory factor (Ser/Thr protein kinase)